MFGPSYIGVMLIGLLHGIEPGHGWPLAFMYSTGTGRPLFNALLSSSILSVAHPHLISSIAVVVAFVLLRQWVDISIPFIKYIAAALLILLAYKLLREKVEDELESQHGHIHTVGHKLEHEHEHEHPNEDRHTHRHSHAKKIALTLWGLTTFAFILGFAHEEEFALLALVAAGINPFFLMLAYAFAVAAALIGITLLCVKAHRLLRPKVSRYNKYLPRVTAFILLLMATWLIVGV